MSFSPQLLALGQYLAGVFDNQEQALAEPVWYVHLRLWHKPVPLFSDDSITLFAEQANILNLDRPYRQRIMRLRVDPLDGQSLQIQYYMPQNPDAIKGAGNNPALLDALTPAGLELLPGCILRVSYTIIAPDCYSFKAFPPPDTVCSFTYLGNRTQVALGFESTTTSFLSYDKGINPNTGQATWGAIIGPYRYMKREQFNLV